MGDMETGNLSDPWDLFPNGPKALDALGKE